MVTALAATMRVCLVAVAAVMAAAAAAVGAAIGWLIAAEAVVGCQRTLKATAAAKY